MPPWMGCKILNTQAKIWLVLIIFLACAGVGFWHSLNKRGLKARGRRRHTAENPPDKNQRRSDKRQLTRQEKKLFTESQRLLSQGKISAGARVLEQLSMPREAIQALEDHGMIHEAARILLRMQRPNRAGVIYARHGMWEHATQCFRIASMPLEAAKCAREAGNFVAAIELFEKAERLEDAAECAIAAKDFAKAFRLHLKVGNEPKAMQILDKALRSEENPGTFPLDESEIQRITQHLGNGASGSGLALALSGRNRLGSVVLLLLAKGMTKQATELYLMPQSDIGPSLMADVNYQTSEAQNLADVFLQVQKFAYAGMVFEKLGIFDAAGDAFEKAQDLDRALYCYERGHFDDKVKLLKRLLSDRKNRINASGQERHKEATITPPPSLEEHVRRKVERYSPPDGITRNLGSFLHDSDTAVLPQPNPNPSKDQEEDIHSSPRSNATSVPAGDVGMFSLGIAEDTGVTEAPPRLPDDLDDEQPHHQKTSRFESSSQQNQLQAFESCRFIEDFSPAQKQDLWHLGETVSFDAGTTVLNYQETPRGLYVITSGQVTCHRILDGEEIDLDTIDQSESFGELWLLTELPTTVCFRAKEKLTLRIISREKFASFLDSDGVIARKVYKKFTNRLLKSLLKPRDSLKNKAAS